MKRVSNKDILIHVVVECKSTLTVYKSRDTIHAVLTSTNDQSCKPDVNIMTFRDEQDMIKNMPWKPWMYENIGHGEIISNKLQKKIRDEGDST